MGLAVAATGQGGQVGAWARGAVLRCGGLPSGPPCGRFHSTYHSHLPDVHQ